VPPLLAPTPELPPPELLELDRPPSEAVLLLLVDPPQAIASVMATEIPKKMRAFFIRSPFLPGGHWIGSG
jgi:hypothetical protein